MKQVIDGMQMGTRKSVLTKEDPCGFDALRQAIVDPDDPEQELYSPGGIFTFRVETFEVVGKDELQSIFVQILRCNGQEGRVSCNFKTEGLSAVEGYDFIEATGCLIFEDGEMTKEVEVEICAQRPNEPSDVFQLVLEEIDGDACFNPHDDGGYEAAILTITISNSEKPALSERIIDWDNLNAGVDAWKDSITGSFVLEEQVGDDGEELPGARSPSDYLSFVIGLPWRLLLNTISPPVHWAGGWLLFVFALGYIAFVTALICDLAKLFGCCTGMEGSVTAITIVALGTSLPDTFASMKAAAMDDTADSSIVNVTGSNSVNVFLGIGIPWLLSAIYWLNEGVSNEWIDHFSKNPDILARFGEKGGFIVQAGNLSFSVSIFVNLAAMHLALLRFRRIAYGGELGGDSTAAKISSAISFMMWLTYIGVSIYRVKTIDAEDAAIPLACLAGLSLLGVIAFDVSGKGRYAPAEEEEEAKTVEPNQEVDMDTTDETPDNQEAALPATIGAAAEDFALQVEEVEADDTTPADEKPTKKSTGEKKEKTGKKKEKAKKSRKSLRSNQPSAQELSYEPAELLS